MRPGAVLLDRFVIERLAGSGGMGMVFRALDRETGSAVAIKVMDGAGAAANRFVREARVLAQLRHPAIVRYVADGVSAEGEPFLAMEWLEGETLSDRLLRGPLPLADSVILATRIAEALGAAHERGVVHRDIKPANVFLVEGRFDRLKVLDFGIARLETATRALTGTGAVIGTIGYMAPEQAGLAGTIDARADVFSLGCVLYECLLGEPAFSGANVMAVLAKVLCDEPPRPSERLSGLPPALDELVVRMLAKRSDARPADGHAMVRELAAVLATGDLAATVALGVPSARTMTEAERRLVSVIVVDTRRAPMSAATMTPEQVLGSVDDVARVARSFGMDTTALATGALLVTRGRSDRRGTDVTDVSAVASCALALRHAVALATGRAQTTGRLPLGLAIDRAVALAAAAGANGEDGVLLDALTHSLVSARFEVRAHGEHRLLLSEKVDDEEPPPVLGRVLPCVGRDIELGTLRATLEGCLDGPMARVVLVTASPGTGKTRLWRELARRAREYDGLRVLIARASPTGAGSQFALMRELVRSALRVTRGDPVDTQRAALDAMVAELFADVEQARASDFLGEAIDLPPRATVTQALRAARSDPQVMVESTRRALEEWLDLYVGTHSVLVVLEDLHWGDSATIALVGKVLRERTERPLMVLASARPEVHEAFPSLWPGHQEIRLGGLPRRAAAALVRGALGNDLPVAEIDGLVTRADGNAFFLEELIRASASGQGTTVPETVLALVESRLLKLDPEARRVLRAARVFGETLWTEGVLALLGDGQELGTVGAWLEALVGLEVLVKHGASRFLGVREYAFRHALWRDAAYSTLTDDDRRAAHARASAWLEAMGETDAVTLAGHCELGGDFTRAARWLGLAADAARAMADYDRAVHLATRGVELGVQGEVLGTLYSVRGAALGWSGRPAESTDDLRGALALLPEGSDARFLAIGGFLGNASVTGSPEYAAEGLAAAYASMDTVPASRAAAEAVYLIVQALATAGAIGEAERFVAVLDNALTTSGDPDPGVIGWYSYARLQLSTYQDDPVATLRHSAAADAALELAGNRSSRMGVVAGRAVALGAIGASSTGHCLALLRTLLVDTSVFAGWDLLAEGYYDAAHGRLPQAALAFDRLTKVARSMPVRQIGLFGLALCKLRTGSFSEAEHLSSSGAADHATIGPLVTCFASVLAPALLARSAAEQALEVADRGLGASGLWMVRSALYLARAEALRALGRVEQSHEAMRVARERIVRMAERFASEGMDAERNAWLTVMPDNVRTLELARQWLDRE